jgi:hypothetical protein
MHKVIFAEKTKDRYAVKSFRTILLFLLFYLLRQLLKLFRDLLRAIDLHLLLHQKIIISMPREKRQSLNLRSYL